MALMLLRPSDVRTTVIQCQTSYDLIFVAAMLVSNMPFSCFLRLHFKAQNGSSYTHYGFLEHTILYVSYFVFTMSLSLKHAEP